MKVRVLLSAVAVAGGVALSLTGPVQPAQAGSCPRVASTSVFPSTVRAGDGAVQTITLSGPARAPFTFVDLSGGDYAYQVTGAGGVRVPAGRTTVQVPVRFDDVANKVVETDLTAVDADGCGPRVSAPAVTVLPLDPAQLAVESVTFSQAGAVAGDRLSATVRLTAPARSRGTGVRLYTRTYNTVINGYPFVAVVPAGQRSVTVPVDALGCLCSVRLFADLGTSLQSAPLFVVEDHLAVTGAVSSGRTRQEVLGLGTRAPAGGAVVHVSTDRAGVHVPATVTVAAGKRGAYFPVTVDEGVDPFGGHLTVRWAGQTASADLFVN